MCSKFGTNETAMSSGSTRFCLYSSYGILILERKGKHESIHETHGRERVRNCDRGFVFAGHRYKLSSWPTRDRPNNGKGYRPAGQGRAWRDGDSKISRHRSRAHRNGGRPGNLPGHKLTAWTL